MSHPRTTGRSVSSGTVPGPIPGGSQPIQRTDPASGTVPTARDGARDAQDLARTEGSLATGTVSAPRQRLTPLPVQIDQPVVVRVIMRPYRWALRMTHNIVSSDTMHAART